MKDIYSLKCPECGNDSDFTLYAEVPIDISRNGTEVDLRKADTWDYDEYSTVICKKCDYNGEMQEFA